MTAFRICRESNGPHQPLFLASVFWVVPFGLWVLLAPFVFSSLLHCVYLGWGWAEVDGGFVPFSFTGSRACSLLNSI